MSWSPTYRNSLAELVGDGGRLEDVAHSRFGKQVGMAPQRPPELYHAVGFELPLQGFELVVDHREVETQGDVAALFPGRVPPDVGAGEGGVEVGGPEAVVVVLQKRHPHGLAEAPGADQEGVVLLFQPAQKAGLVDVQPAAQADAPEVALTVGNVRVRGSRSLVHCRTVPGFTLSHARRPLNARARRSATGTRNKPPRSRSAACAVTENDARNTAKIFRL